LPADDVVHRDKDVAAPVRAVLEHLHRRQMAAADLDAGQMGRDQRDRDAEVFLLAHEMIGIIGLEGETEQRRDRSQRDVALVPVQPQAQHFAAFEIALADDAGIDHRGRIGAGFRAGQAEAGNVGALGQPRQPPVLLLLGAEAHQQFARPERVRHHHGDGRRSASARKVFAPLRNAHRARNRARQIPWG
jgi:hypothetical protein